MLSQTDTTGPCRELRQHPGRARHPWVEQAAHLGKHSLFSQLLMVTAPWAPLLCSLANSSSLLQALSKCLAPAREI